MDSASLLQNDSTDWSDFSSLPLSNEKHSSDTSSELSPKSSQHESPKYEVSTKVVQTSKIQHDFRSINAGVQTKGVKGRTTSRNGTVRDSKPWVPFIVKNDGGFFIRIHKPRTGNDVTREPNPSGEMADLNAGDQLADGVKASPGMTMRRPRIHPRLAMPLSYRITADSEGICVPKTMTTGANGRHRFTRNSVPRRRLSDKFTSLLSNTEENFKGNINEWPRMSVQDMSFGSAGLRKISHPPMHSPIVPMNLVSLVRIPRQILDKTDLFQHRPFQLATVSYPHSKIRPSGIKHWFQYLATCIESCPLECPAIKLELLLTARRLQRTDLPLTFTRTLIECCAPASHYALGCSRVSQEHEPLVENRLNHTVQLNVRQGHEKPRLVEWLIHPIKHLDDNMQPVENRKNMKNHRRALFIPRSHKANVSNQKPWTNNSVSASTQATFISVPPSWSSRVANHYVYSNLNRALYIRQPTLYCSFTVHHTGPSELIKAGPSVNSSPHSDHGRESWLTDPVSERPSKTRRNDTDSCCTRTSSMAILLSDGSETNDSVDHYGSIPLTPELGPNEYEFLVDEKLGAIDEWNSGDLMAGPEDDAGYEPVLMIRSAPTHLISNLDSFEGPNFPCLPPISMTTSYFDEYGWHQDE